MYLGAIFSAFRRTATLVLLPGLLAALPQERREHGNSVTFYDHVLPILQRYCLSCHVADGIGPMPLGTYGEVRPRAAEIREAVKQRRMPPRFADPRYVEFAHVLRLTDDEIQMIDTWASFGTLEGKLPKSRRAIAAKDPPRISADVVVTAPRPISIPANKRIDYQYLIFALTYRYDRWVRAVEIRPSDRSLVHHAVLYVREKQSHWLRNAVPGVPYVPPDIEALRQARSPKADILAIYTPGAPAMICPPGMAKKLPAGADLVLQVHYASQNTPGSDQPQIGLAMQTEPPGRRILTLRMELDEPPVPPEAANLKASVSGTLTADALLVRVFPHLHLLGVPFHFDITGPNGHIETILQVNSFWFNWPLTYVLKTPRLLQKGTVLTWTGTFSDSGSNPLNQDPAVEVRSGGNRWDGIMIGYIDLAVEPAVDSQMLFAR